ncbi:MFS transporter [Trinickia dinghuensis]|uniref:MFS transporter n=1 Tax=Trinickia dinghuensis TaxID=2291023 RepID=A0A3D8K8B1_9BURK|nr:MFS transporter [Trinickia dinghuensis]RDV00882.1 MFS transporter [Trinickia dinghuensis]
MLESRPYTRSIADTAPPARSWEVALLMAAASIGYFVVQLDVSIVNLSLPAMQAYYHADVATLQWIVNAYTLAFSVFLLSSGVLGDRYGSKRFLMVGYALFFVGSLACGCAPTVAFMLGARFVQGLGAAIIVPNSLAVINWSFAGRNDLRLSLLSVWMAFGGAALTSGPIIGGVITSFASWRYIFFINLPVCVAGLVLTSRFVKTPPKGVARANDWAGQLLLLGASAALLVLIINFTGLSSLTVSALGVAALAGLAAFVRTEKRTVEPAIPLDLFVDRSLQRALVLGIVVNFLYFGVVFFASLYFRDTLGMSSLQAGLAFIPVTLPLIAANITSGKLSRRGGPERSILAGLSLLIPGTLLLALPIMRHAYWPMLPAFMLVSFGVGLITPMITATALQTIGPERGGMISAVVNFARQIAGAFGVAVFGLFIAQHDNASASWRDFSIALLATAVVLLLCAHAFRRATVSVPSKV